MNQKEKWLHEIQNSLEGIESPEVNPYLYSKILNRLQTKTNNYVSTKLVFASSIAIVVLIVLNIFIFKSTTNNSTVTNRDLKKLSFTFNLINENTINYN